MNLPCLWHALRVLVRHRATAAQVAALSTVLLLGTFSIAAAADDEAIAQLEAFTRSIDTFSASFQQTLYDEDSEPLQTSEGTVVLKRPGRFVWRYTEPEAQEIVADGTRIWLYDQELEQVTVNAIDERLAGTPLVLLMGDAPLTEAFEVEALGEEEGVQWLELTPRAEGSDFETVFIGLIDGALSAMELRDNFGQATQIRFADFESGIELDDDLFDFKVPEGVDVIGDPGN